MTNANGLLSSTSAIAGTGDAVTNPKPEAAPLATDLLWGVDSIAKFTGLPLRKTYYFIQRGKLPTRKLGPKTIVASRADLRAFFTAQGDKE